MQLPVLEDLGDLTGASVLLRADFNCPFAINGAGETVITDDYRIRATLPTIEWLLAAGARVTACTHFGRPKGTPNPKYAVAPLRARLNELAPGVELLENLRFSPGEEGNDPAFVEELCAGHDVFVNDAFGAAHRAHASIVGPPGKLPSAAGRLLQREVEMCSKLLESPERPFVAIVGGAKIADKLGVLQKLAGVVDVLIVGGGMGWTFWKALDRPIGESLLDESHLASCLELLNSSATVLISNDAVALGPGGELHFGEPAPASDEVATFSEAIPSGWTGLDIGPATRERFAAAIASAQTVLWNGPMGVFEDARFAAGTKAVAEAVAATGAFTVAGGGDSVAAINEYGLADRIDHVSSGGGATLEFIELGDLPGLAALRHAAGNA